VNLRGRYDVLRGMWEVGEESAQYGVLRIPRSYLIWRDKKGVQLGSAM